MFKFNPVNGALIVSLLAFNSVAAEEDKHACWRLINVWSAILIMHIWKKQNLEEQI